MAVELLLLTAVLVAIGTGPIPLAAGRVLAALLGSGAGADGAIVWTLRAPRTLLAALVGAVLGFAGVVMQGLFRNRLADPGLLGVSAGGALGAVAAIVLGVPLLPEALRPAAVAIAAFAGRWFDTLWGGEQQRVHLARVFAQLTGTPPGQTALLLDEPTSALDWPQQHALLGSARGRAAAGAAVLIVLHDIAHAARYCDRILLLADGRRVAEGDPADALTEATIAATYGRAVRRIVDPADGASLFVPL